MESNSATSFIPPDCKEKPLYADNLYFVEDRNDVAQFELKE